MTATEWLNEHHPHMPKLGIPKDMLPELLAEYGEFLVEKTIRDLEPVDSNPKP